MAIVATSSAEISWPQQQTVLPGGHYDIYRDDKDSVIDYSQTVNPTPIEAWPDGEGKVGDGLGADGMGPDGYGYGGIGDGNGADGLGLDGFGAAMISHVTPPLADGTWTFAVLAFDPAGNPSSPSGGTTVQETLAGTPRAPASILATNWDNPTGTLTLTIGLSPDDS